MGGGLASPNASPFDGLGLGMSPTNGMGWAVMNNHNNFPAELNNRPGSAMFEDSLDELDIDDIVNTIQRASPKNAM